MPEPLSLCNKVQSIINQSISVGVLNPFCVELFRLPIRTVNYALQLMVDSRGHDSRLEPTAVLKLSRVSLASNTCSHE